MEQHHEAEGCSGMGYIQTSQGGCDQRSIWDEAIPHPRLHIIMYTVTICMLQMDVTLAGIGRPWITAGHRSEGP